MAKIGPSHHVKMQLYSKQITKNMQSNQGRTKAPVQIIKKGQKTNIPWTGERKVANAKKREEEGLWVYTLDRRQ